MNRDPDFLRGQDEPFDRTIHVFINESRQVRLLGSSTSRLVRLEMLWNKLSGRFGRCLQQHGGSLLIAIMDDALVGVGAGLLVLLYERRQSQNIIRKLEVIRMMNHHVRNSLEVISFASDSQQEELANKQLS